MSTHLVKPSCDVLARAFQEKDALYSFADRLQNATSPEDIYDAALHAILATLPCERASVLLLDGAREMRFVASKGLSECYRKQVEGHSPWNALEKKPTPICIEDVEASDLSPTLKEVIRTEGIRALAFIPLISGGMLIGKFMVYCNTPHVFDSDEIELSLTIARQLALAIDRRRAGEALRASEQRFREMIDALPAAIYTTDAQGRLTHFNRAAVEFSGRLPQLGTDEWCVTWKLYHPDGTPMPHAACPMAVTLQQGQKIRGAEAIAERPDGTRRWFMPYPTPLCDASGRVVGGINMLVDITDRKQAEEALSRSETKLREDDRRKDEFLAMLAHELRNPLAPIVNAVHLLAKNPSADPIQQQVRSIIDRQAARLTRLVDDLLEVSRITSGRIQLHRERIGFAGVIERAIETVRPLVEQHRHSLAVSIPNKPIWLDADATRLEQVIVNLLNNAAKYMDAGGSIEVKAEADADHIVLRVIDSGIGIEPELLPRIFDLFTQSDRSLDRSSGGLGIGLSLVQRLVEMHGGTVKVESAVGHGSVFTVRLPLATEPQPVCERAPPALGAPLISAIRILVVDDNIDAAQSFGMILEACGHQVRLAYEGEAALIAAEEHRPQVIFLDIGLPKIDGFEVARRLRLHPAHQGILLVAVSGYGQQSDRERAYAAGFDHHLVKPADMSVVESILVEIGKPDCNAVATGTHL